MFVFKKETFDPFLPLVKFEVRELLETLNLRQRPRPVVLMFFLKKIDPALSLVGDFRMHPHLVCWCFCWCLRVCVFLK